VIILRHVPPNTTVATITFSFILNGSITTLTSLDFARLACRVHLGELLAQGKANLQAPVSRPDRLFVLAAMLSLLILSVRRCATPSTRARW
jgi:ABC-type microcin C transport system permease subunit YejE